MIVVTTAPSYLFWRCAPPELRVPQLTLAALVGIAETTVAVGPHGSTTPRATLRKLGVDAVVMGECEEILRSLAETPRRRWGEIAGLCRMDGGDAIVRGGPQAADMARLPALALAGRERAAACAPSPPLRPAFFGPGAEMEVSRGCPYHCTFCAKENFRNLYRRRPLATILDELDGLIAAGSRTSTSSTKFSCPGANCSRPGRAAGRVRRADAHRSVDGRTCSTCSGAAGCVSIEAGVESLDAAGRDRLAKDCRLSTEELTERLDSCEAQRAVRSGEFDRLRRRRSGRRSRAGARGCAASGVWANEPVPLFPYPGSPDYRRLWGLPDDDAWERALEQYLDRYAAFSDIQEARPRRLAGLELP